MFDQIQERLTGIFKNLSKKGKISETNISDALRDVRRAMLEADVNFRVAKKFISNVHKKAVGQKVLGSITPGQQFVQVVKEELIELLGSGPEKIKIKNSGITKILLVGLQGVGKTTTAAKLACFLKKERQLDCMLVAADRKRPAAIEQLELLAKQNKISFFSTRDENATNVVKKSIDYANSESMRIVIIDTAGRLQEDTNLMLELKEISDTIVPDETIFVADAMTGQDAVNSSKIFSEVLNVTGIILTKMDADTRGGAAVSIKEVTGKKIKFIGNGETINDLEVFNPINMANRILGMGDVLSLVDKAKNLFDSNESEKNQKKLLDGTFDLTDFENQLNQFSKMGSMNSIIKMLPAKGIKKIGNIEDKKLIWMNAILSSMTLFEKRNPSIINGSRRKRIALGSGRSVFEVNQLLKQFFQMKTMMKKMKKNKGMFPFNFK